jgi:predicted nucleic acid-binding protein
VAHLIFLDSEPVGLASQVRGKPRADACRGWLQGLEVAGARILVPEIVDYEVRRELVRVGATAGLRRLDGLLARFPLLPLDRPSLLRAADL